MDGSISAYSYDLSAFSQFAEDVAMERAIATRNRRPVTIPLGTADGQQITPPEYHHNYCPQCEVPLAMASSSEYCCPQCGLIASVDADVCKDRSETAGSCLRVTTGAAKGRQYNIAGDYSRTQRKKILDQLSSRQTQRTITFPLNILGAVATQYNNIQRALVDTDNRFVKRMAIKDEILASLLYFECIREGIVRKKKDIAVFMGLPTNGFARGEDIVRGLAANMIIDIPDDEPIAGYVDRYLEALNLEGRDYEQFITDLVEMSIEHKIGMTSQVPSKVVGGIWIVITKLRLPITSHTLEKAADNTKKNTFMKFYNNVCDNPTIFGPAFVRHSIPM